MLLWLIIGYLGFGFVWQWSRMGFPLSPLVLFAIPYGFIRGLWVFVLTHSVWVVIWYALLIVSIDIMTPPFVLGSEILFAAPVGWFMMSLGVPKALAIVLSFVLVFVVAALIIIIHFMYMRKLLRKL